MEPRFTRRFGEPPRYAAELPWIGPVLSTDEKDGVGIGAASDPALGNALAAVLVPLGESSEAGLIDRAWVMPVDADARGRFRIKAPSELWPSGDEKVLLALLYDRSASLYDAKTRRNVGRMFPDTWTGQLDHFRSTATGPGRLSRLPQRMREEIRRRIATLLRKKREDVELALIQIAPGHWDRAVKRKEIAFAVASCQYPAGFLDGDVAEGSYDRLARWLDEGKEPRPRGLLLLGDQVYIDATAGLFDPKIRFDRFELPHQRWLRMRGARQVLRRLPVYPMLDDHEIEDNWEPASGDRAADEALRSGRTSYVGYQRIAGPRPRDRVGDSPSPLWYDFKIDGFPFFIADSRTERVPRTAETIADARIMSHAQFGALLAWLENQEEGLPKFVASPAALLPRHRRASVCPASALRSDGWDGYPGSLYPLLAYIAENAIPDVVFLSGDEHISFVTHAMVEWSGSPAATLLNSIHSSGLYSPFPFANSIHDDLAADDEFSFELTPQVFPESGGRSVAGGRYRCRVRTEFAPLGDGFGIVQARPSNGPWQVTCSFIRGAEPRAHRAPMTFRTRA